LHAATIRFAHPSTGAAVCFRSPLPDDLLNFMKLERAPDFPLEVDQG